MAKDLKLAVGTKIRFSMGVSRNKLLLAYNGEEGEIVGYGMLFQYLVRSDHWPNSFGASREEFEIIGENISQCRWVAQQV